MRASRGATLLELLTALTLMALLGTLAVPGFGKLAHDSERTAAVNTFLHALFFARSEAIKRGGVVSLCKSIDGSTCANSRPDWAGGWIVFANHDRDDPPVRDEEEAVLAVYQGWQGIRVTSNRQSYSFRPYLQGVVNGTVLFCDPRGSSEARAIIISHTGRPRVSQRASGNKPLRCPAG